MTCNCRVQKFHIPTEVMKSTTHTTGKVKFRNHDFLNPLFPESIGRGTIISETKSVFSESRFQKPSYKMSVSAFRFTSYLGYCISGMVMISILSHGKFLKWAAIAAQRQGLTLAHLSWQTDVILWLQYYVLGLWWVYLIILIIGLWFCLTPKQAKQRNRKAEHYNRLIDMVYDDSYFCPKCQGIMTNYNPKFLEVGMATLVQKIWEDENINQETKNV